MHSEVSEPQIYSMHLYLWLQGFPGGSVVKESVCQCRSCKRCGFNPRVRKIPWRRKWQPTPVFLPGECHGERSLVGCSSWGYKRVRHDLAAKQKQPQLWLFLPTWSICLLPETKEYENKTLYRRLNNQEKLHRFSILIRKEPWQLEKNFKAYLHT